MRTGLDVLRDEGFERLRGRRVGLVTHPAARDDALRSAFELFAGAGHFTLAALFGPEHGFTGEAQDLIPVGDGGLTGWKVHSLYGDTAESLKPTPAMLDDLDVLVIDLVDVGSRYYTFQATMLYCMEACAAVGVPVLILDRPNPLGRAVEGPTIRSGFESFVGPHPIATRHGLTMGELATLYRAERVPDVQLTVVTCREWTPGDGWGSRFWFPPSPNMPTLDTVRVYPGLCLIEGTNLSEGRGTTRPFEFVGHPEADGFRVVARLTTGTSPNADFLAERFRPTFQKHAGRSCGGVFVVPQLGFRPVRTGLAVVIAFYQHLLGKFAWRTERYEFVDDIPAIDLLFGSDRERTMIEAGASWQDIATTWEPEEDAFRERRRPHLLYPE